MEEADNEKPSGKFYTLSILGKYLKACHPTDPTSTEISFDCGTSVAPADEELSCGEQNPSFHMSAENRQCLWHFYV